MADISREVQDFRDAVYGEEVRGSMISLAEKVNTESTDAKTAAVKSASDAGAAASNASYAVTQANAAVQSANKAAQNIQDKADRGDFTSTIQIGEVTTGEPGTEASASNSGTPKDAVIDLTIPQGYQGVSMRMAGTWTAGTEYVNNTSYIDLVTYNGSTYGCKQSHTASEAILPTNEGYWQVIAKKGDTGSVENIDTIPIEFEEAEERENVETGDTITTVFGKVKKWFSSLKQAAFYDVVNNVLQTEPGQKVLDAAVGKYLDEKKFDISRLVANRNITEPGFAMDGKTLVEWLNELNGNVISTMGGRSLCIQTRMLFDTKYSDHFELLKGYWNELGDPSCFGSFVFVLTNFNTDRCFWICGIYGTRDFGIAIQFPRGSYSALSLRRYNNGVWETPTILS